MIVFRLMALMLAALFALAFSPDDTPDDDQGDKGGDDDKGDKGGKGGDDDDKGGAGAGGDDDKGDKGDKGGQAHKTLTFATEKDEEEYYDRIFGKRYKRKKDELKEEAKAEAKREAEREAAQKQGNFEKLYNDEVEAHKTTKETAERVETLEADISAKDERIKALETRLEGVIKPDIERVPEEYREFVEAMNVEERAAWLEKHAEKLRAKGDGKVRPAGSPATGTGRRQGSTRRAGDDDEKREENARRGVRARI